MRYILNAFFCVALFFSCALYAEKKASQKSEVDVVILPFGTVHEGDYFVSGDSVEISGTVTGDLYVFASQLFIDGIVKGDALVSGGSIDISGEIAQNLRAVCGQIMFSGTVGRNAAIAAGNATFTSSGNIQGNLVCSAGNIDLGSTIGNDVRLFASNARVSNTITHNLQGVLGQLRLTSKAKVGGNVTYSSNQDAYIDAGASIGGQVVHHPSFVKKIFEGSWINAILLGSHIATFLMNFFYTLAVGAILLRFFPDTVSATLAVMHKKPGKAFIFGVFLMVVLPIISLLLLMTVLGVPFALTLLALNIIGFYSAKVYSVMWASNKLLKKVGLKENRFWTFFFGLVIYFGVAAIPFFGKGFALVAMLFGLGAAMLGYTKTIHLRKAHTD